MCELFGRSGRSIENVTPLLKEFYSHAVDHPDGWGLYLNNETDTFSHKEPKRADRSEKLKNILDGEIRAKNVIAHIRLATIGYDTLCNTHPFSGFDISGREWVLAHNGTIFRGDSISKYFYTQDGDTDSERILLYLLDMMNRRIREKSAPLKAEERFDVIRGITTELSPHNKLNLLIYDEEVLYVHTNFRDSLFMSKGSDGLLFSTRPLSKGTWEPVPFLRLISCRNGRVKQMGDSHNNEYIPDPGELKALFMAYSGL